MSDTPGLVPQNWPRNLPPPHDPLLPRAVLGWLREAAPSEEWRITALRQRPWTAVIQITFALDRLIDGLRDSYRQTTDMHKGLLPAGDLRALLAAHTAEAERLGALRQQVAEVERALVAMGDVR